MSCGPYSAVDVCRGIQYTFAIYTITLAIAGGLAQLVASRMDLRSRPGAEDVDYKISEFGFAPYQRKNQRAVDRRRYGLLSSAWLGLSIALVISAVMSSLTINFPWFYGGGLAALFAPLIIASIPFVLFYCSQGPGLEWLKGTFGDDLTTNVILEHDALIAVDEILTVSGARFRELKRTVAGKRQERQDRLNKRPEEHTPTEPLNSVPDAPPQDPHEP